MNKSIEIIVISATDVQTFSAGKLQSISPQTLANSRAAVDYYNDLKDEYECYLYVMGGNGDTYDESGNKLSYLRQKYEKFKNPNKQFTLQGGTEAELTEQYLLENAINPEHIVIESQPQSKNTMENAWKLAEFLNEIFSQNIDTKVRVRVFAWEIDQIDVFPFLTGVDVSKIRPVIDSFKAVLDHSKRVEYTYRKILQDFISLGKLELKVTNVTEFLGSEAENSQTHLRKGNQPELFTVQLLAWLKTFIDLEIKGEKSPGNDSKLH